jgi:multiple antibiotic resistance protein
MLFHEILIYTDFLLQSIYPIQNYAIYFPSSISIVTSTFSHFTDSINIQDLLTSTIALFVVMDPIGVIPLFVSLTRNMSNLERKAVSSNAVITTGILLLLFAIAGTTILSVFGVTISSFMIAGGILLFIVAIELLTRGEWTFGNPKTITTIRKKSTNTPNNLNSDAKITPQGESGVVPLAFPLLAGPGAITSVMISYQANGLLISILSIAIVIGLTYMILRIAESINRLLGQRGSMIVTRVFAVIVAAIAIQYIIQGTGQTITDFNQDIV